MGPVLYQYANMNIADGFSSRRHYNHARSWSLPILSAASGTKKIIMSAEEAASTSLPVVSVLPTLDGKSVEVNSMNSTRQQHLSTEYIQTNRTISEPSMPEGESRVSRHLDLLLHVMGVPLLLGKTNIAFKC